MANNKYKLSIIIVSWNTIEATRACLESVYSNIKEISFETVVVDNASVDGSADMVSEKFPEVALIRNSDNVGFGAAVNQAASTVAGEYILLLNSDAQLVDGDIIRLINILDKNQDIGIITGEMLNASGEAMPSYFAFPSVWRLVKANTTDIVYGVGAGIRGKARNCTKSDDGLEICDVDWVSGGYLVLRHKLAGNGLIFDKRLFMFFEDTLLCRKIWDMGHRVVFSPIAAVLHKQGSSTKKRLNESLLASFMSSRVYVQEVYSEKVLRRYDHIVMLIWKISMRLLIVLSHLALGSKARVKAQQIEYLINHSEIG